MSSISINIKIPARPATPERLEEWTAEKIRELFGEDPDCLVMKLLDLCEMQSTEILTLKNQIRECEKDFLNYSRTNERSTGEIEKLQNQLADCAQSQRETREKILQAVGIHEIKKH